MPNSLLASYSGVYGSAGAWLVAELARSNPKLLVLSKDKTSAERIFEDIRFFARDRASYLLSPWETLPFEPVSPQLITSAERLAALTALTNIPSGIWVTSVDTLLQRVLPKDLVARATFTLAVGQSYERQALLNSFDRAGYQRMSLAEDIGEMAVRGAIIDFFPARSLDPIRLQFRDDLLIDLRHFSADNQRSHSDSSLRSYDVIPVTEALTFPSIDAGAEHIDHAVCNLKARAKELETPPTEVQKIIQGLKEDVRFPGIELFAPFLAPLEAVVDLLPDGLPVIVEDRLNVSHKAESTWELIDERATRLAAEHYLIPRADQLFVRSRGLWSSLLSRPHYFINNLEVLGTVSEPSAASIQLRSQPLSEFTTQLRAKISTGKFLSPLKRKLSEWHAAGCAVTFVVGSISRAERLRKLLVDIKLDAQVIDDGSSPWLRNNRQQSLTIVRGHIHQGFELTRERLVFIAEQEIFAERSYRSTAAKKLSLKRLMSALAQLKDGDYIVHVDFGIGIYRGLIQKTIEGATTDLLHLEYADSRLYLPAHNIGKIQKFVSAEGTAPAVDKLSSTRWQKTKQKVRESVETLAGELIKLYAARNVVKGWRFDPAGAEDERFADSFAYNETPDQQAAIEATLKDMADEKPMDRLVCGDVGFGKTEVALRAAFKCIQHARQVAVLVPTTVLAEQHLDTFSKRLLEHPVRVKALSRFRSAEENKKTLAELVSGELDIVIGTHRLLQRDVHFRDLGLVVVDEEHRFGVKQKERLKQMKARVDVLSLTATPIPRTLHMSLLGIRDISVISTPPQDRRVIQTYVAATTDSLIRDAVLRELRRGGQVFFVHNRVESIGGVTARLRELVPEARFDCGHGQMTEDKLERLMAKFIRHEFDVLVCTTIIESGLDIPNANTIIVDRADTFGLAQLYQLRGRVGRSTRQAYAYLMVPPSGKMGADAQQRLKALQSLDDLGLGFNLAMRDLEIRGAGNLLGKEQSGNVLAVGFDLYNRILQEAILNLKGEEISLEALIEPEINWEYSAYIPEWHIPDISERLLLYQRLAQAITSHELDELRQEMEDRFGPFGEEVANLIELMRLRALLRSVGIAKADVKSERIVLGFSPRTIIDSVKLLKLCREQPKLLKIGKNSSVTIQTFGRQVSPSERYKFIQEFLSKIVDFSAHKSIN